MAGGASGAALRAWVVAARGGGDRSRGARYARDMTAAEKLLEEVLALPRAERAKLVARVAESLAESEQPKRTDFVAEARVFVDQHHDLLERLAK